MKMKSIVLAALCSCTALAQADEMSWYKHEMDCGGARVTVRTYCELNSGPGVVAERTKGCSRAEVLVSQAGRKPARGDLLQHEPVEDDFHFAETLRCVPAGGRHYLHVQLSTGGSCDTCEIDGIMGLDGRWKRFGERWMVAKAERRSLERAAGGWGKVPELDLNTPLRDDRQDGR